MNAEVVIQYDSPQDSTRGAGVLLYMTRGEGPGREIAFVLGQESYVKDWNQSGCWSAFEGGRKAGESCEQTAAREFVEETVGAVPLFGTSDPAQIAVRLAQGEYALRVSVNRGSGTAQQRNHVMFLVRIPWGTPVVEMFASVYGPLNHLQQCALSAATASARAEAMVPQDPRRAAICAERQERRKRTHLCLSTLPAHLRSHPALAGTADDPVVSIDYLEKRAVQVVPMRRLEQVLSRRDTRVVPHGLRLRFSFVPVIKTVIHELKTRAGV